jgi:hypothetical protein
MRRINSRFIDDLLNGKLTFFLNEVKSQRDKLSLEIRNGYINIYYKGGNLLKITQKSKGYSFHFDVKYCKHKSRSDNLELFNNAKKDDDEFYAKYFNVMKNEMDKWFEEHPKKERDYQHQLLVNNMEIIDIEYQIGRCMRLDMLMFSNGKLYVVENKYGMGSIGGDSGLSKHYNDICNVLTFPKLLGEMLDSVCFISQNKKDLGLIDYSINGEDVKETEILFLLADYKPKSKSFLNALCDIDGSIPARVLMNDKDYYKIDLSRTRDVSRYEN